MKKFFSFSLFALIVILALIARKTANGQIMTRPTGRVVTTDGYPGHAATVILASGFDATAGL